MVVERSGGGVGLASAAWATLNAHKDSAPDDWATKTQTIRLPRINEKSRLMNFMAAFMEWASVCELQ